MGPNEWRTNKKLAGGGPLFDVGIYSLNACRYLTGEEPQHISAYASTNDHDARFRRSRREHLLDDALPFRHSRHLQHHLWREHAGLFHVYGSKGWLQVDQAFVYEGLRLRGFVDGKDIDEPNPARDPSQFQAEAEHFSHCVQNNLEPQSPGEEGLKRHDLHHRDLSLCGNRDLEKPRQDCGPPKRQNALPLRIAAIYCWIKRLPIRRPSLKISKCLRKSASPASRSQRSSRRTVRLAQEKPIRSRMERKTLIQSLRPNPTPVTRFRNRGLHHRRRPGHCLPGRRWNPYCWLNRRAGCDDRPGRKISA
jgi:hypothetical protein